MKLKAYGAGFEGVKEFDLPVKANATEAVIDLAALKIPPGEHTIAFYGSAVAKYSYNPQAVKIAEEEKKKAEAEAAKIAAEAKKLAGDAANAPAEKKTEMATAAKAAEAKQKEAEAMMTKMTAKVKAATDAAAPKEIVDIYVSAPIRVSVKPKAACTGSRRSGSRHHRAEMIRRFSKLWGLCQGSALLGILSPVVAVEKPEFYQDVYPFLKANCLACHNKTTAKAGLNMETPELMIKGGDSGPSIVPGKSAESLLVEASVHSPDIEMPPPNNKSGAVKLTDAEIAVLKTWIDQGAKAGVQAERQVTFKALAPGIDPIYSLALTKDGRHAVCGRGHRLFLYDLAARQLVAEITDPAVKGGGAHRAMVQSLAFSPDGARLASGSFREVKLWKREVVTSTHPPWPLRNPPTRPCSRRSPRPERSRF